MRRYKKHSKQSQPSSAPDRRAQKLQLAAGVAIGVFIMLVAALVVVGVSYAKKPVSSSIGLQKALRVTASNQNLETIRSTLKFSLTYDNRQFKSQAYQVGEGGKTFTLNTGKELLTPRDYSIIELYDKQLDSKTPAKVIAASQAEFRLSTNIHSDFFAKHGNDFGPGLSQLDVTEKFFAPKAQAGETITTGATSKVTVNGVTYRRVLYQTTSTKYLTSKHTSETYYAVQDNKPYAVHIERTDDKDQAFVTSLRGLLSAINYGEKSQASTYGAANAGDKGKISKLNSGDTANLPSALADGTALQVAAKNQPAVVRIGGNYCADITLLLPNKTPYMTVKDACSPVVGSGSIVSADGYISTNGHVVRQTPPLALMTALVVQSDTTQLKQYLQYLVVSKILSAEQLDQLLSAAQAGDAEANAKLQYSAENIPRENIVAANVFNEYAIQLSNNPIRVTQTGNKFRFQYTSDVVQAKYIDSNFDPYSGSGGTSNITEATSSDVAILKIEGKNYPTVQMGSIAGLHEGDLITAIGFPAFVDDGLLTKLPHTVPSITQGRVLIITYDSQSKERKIVGSDTPIAGGNSGGPAFTRAGEMAGLNTYGQVGCPDDQCFGKTSFFRDVADYKALLQKNKITTKNSNLQSTWSSGIDSFASANYSQALSDFKTAKSQYPQLYLAGSFISEAQAGVDAINHKKLLALGAALLFLALLACLAVILRIIIRLRRHRAGTMPTYPTTPSYQAPPGYPAQPYAPTVPAQQMPAPPAQPQPTTTTAPVGQTSSSYPWQPIAPPPPQPTAVPPYPVPPQSWNGPVSPNQSPSQAAPDSGQPPATPNSPPGSIITPGQ